MTRLYELAFVVCCLPTAAALVFAAAVTAAMWLIRASLAIPDVRSWAFATAERLLPEPRKREAHIYMGAVKTILADLDAAISSLEEHGHQLAGRFRDLYRQLVGEIPTVVPADETTAPDAAGDVDKAAPAADSEVKA